MDIHNPPRGDVDNISMNPINPDERVITPEQWAQHYAMIVRSFDDFLKGMSEQLRRIAGTCESMARDIEGNKEKYPPSVLSIMVRGIRGQITDVLEKFADKT